MSAIRKLRRKRRHRPPSRVRQVAQELGTMAVRHHGAHGVRVDRQLDGWKLTAMRHGQAICFGCGAPIDPAIVLSPRGLHHLSGRRDPIGIATCPLCVPESPLDRTRGVA